MRSSRRSVGSARRLAPNTSGVSPDIITTAKGITNGAMPMGAVFVK